MRHVTHIPVPVHGGQDPDNMDEERIAWGLDLLGRCCKLTGTDTETAIRDAIAYLLHAAVEMGQDPAYELFCAVDHFNAETGEG